MGLGMGRTGNEVDMGMRWALVWGRCGKEMGLGVGQMWEGDGLVQNWGRDRQQTWEWTWDWGESTFAYCAMP